MANTYKGTSRPKKEKHGRRKRQIDMRADTSKHCKGDKGVARVLKGLAINVVWFDGVEGMMLIVEKVIAVVAMLVVVLVVRCVGVDLSV